MEDIIYLDNSSTTKPCEECVDAMKVALSDNWGNPSSLHKLGIESEKSMTDARRAIAKALHCEDKEIFFTSGGTEANNLAIFGAAKALAKRGKRVVTTAIEHHSVLECFDELEKQGFEVIRIIPDRFGQISEEAIFNAVNSETMLVSIMLINNETGAILPVSAARRAIDAASAPALLHADAVQAFGKTEIDVKKLGVDLLSVSAHKIHGPKGIGALYKAASARIVPHSIGGGQEKGIRGGTEATPAICGFGAAVKAMDISSAKGRVSELYDYALGLLSDINGITFNSFPGGSPYILNISLKGYRSETVLHFLEARNIFVSSGSACAKGKGSHVLTSMGLDRATVDGAVRISFSKQNTTEDIDALAEGLKSAMKMLRRSAR